MDILWSPMVNIHLCAAALGAALLAGCATPSGTSPLTKHVFAAECADSDTLLVMLPGLHDRAAEMAEHGLVDVVHRSGAGIDVVTVDAHLGYYKDRTLIDRLRRDVIEPAKTSGYSSIWLAGISLGGLGSLLYSQSHPQDVDRLFLLAPYLGRPSTADLLESAGGVAAWRSAASRMLVHEERAWSWLHTLSRRQADAPEVFLGYGHLDRYAKSHELVADALPADRVVSVAGGHDWKTWAELWQRLGTHRNGFAGTACR